MYLHASNILPILSKLLAKQQHSHEVNDNQDLNHEFTLKVSTDITKETTINASSREAMTKSLVDNETNSFWEYDNNDAIRTIRVNVTDDALSSTRLVESI